MSADPRYDITLADPVSGETLGLKLDAPFQWQSAQQMATRITEAQDWRSFDEWSVLEQSSFHHGRGLEKWDSSDPERFYDSYNVDTRIRDQMTLAPLATTTASTSDGFLVHSATYPEPTGTGIAQTKIAQSFTCTAHTCKKIALYLQRIGASQTVTLRVEKDSSGSPSGTLVHGNLTTTATVGNTTPAWIEFDFGATGAALSGSTTYWLVVTSNATGTTNYLRVYGAAGNPYANGACKVFVSGAWEAATAAFDFLFDLRSVSSMAGIPIAFCQMGTKFYCAAGKAVYEWDNTSKYWVAKKTDFTANVTDMAAFAGKLFCAQGSSYDIFTFDGTSTWAQLTGAKAYRLLVYKGYLYRGYNGTSGEVYYTADGTTWSASPWYVGNKARGESIRGMAGYEYDVYVFTDLGVYLLGPESRQGDLVDQILDFTSQGHYLNGWGAKAWAKDGKLYFNIFGSLLSYQEGLLDSVGPDRDAGLPDGRQGFPVSLISLNNWLIAAVNGGSGTSSVMAYNGSGWHELFRAPGAAQQCAVVGYDTTATPHKLWFGFGNQAGYIELPDTTDNPYEYSSSAYASQGYLITPWIDMDLLSVDKDFQEFGVQCDMPATGTLTVSYEIDRYGSWEQLFSVDADDMGGVYTHTFPFEDAFAFSPHTIASGSTALTVNVASTTGLEASDWVRINDEIRQIASITDSGTFVLNRALSSAPAVGDIVYPARPCGAEIRFKIELATTNSAYTPKLQAWWLKCMPMIRDKLAGAFSAKIYDGQRDYPQAAEIPASTRSALLYSFAKRPTPIDLTDMGGTTRRVKITNIQETQEYTGEGAMAHARVPVSTFSVSVVEV